MYSIYISITSKSNAETRNRTRKLRIQPYIDQGITPSELGYIKILKLFYDSFINATFKTNYKLQLT